MTKKVLDSDAVTYGEQRDRDKDGSLRQILNGLPPLKVSLILPLQKLMMILTLVKTS